MLLLLHGFTLPLLFRVTPRLITVLPIVSPLTRQQLLLFLLKASLVVLLPSIPLMCCIRVVTGLCWVSTLLPGLCLRA